MGAIGEWVFFYPQKVVWLLKPIPILLPEARKITTICLGTHNNHRHKSCPLTPHTVKLSLITVSLAFTSSSFLRMQCMNWAARDVPRKFLLWQYSHVERYGNDTHYFYNGCRVASLRVHPNSVVHQFHKLAQRKLPHNLPQTAQTWSDLFHIV